jgi:hypothetical protein
MSILLATTLTTYAMQDPGTWASWLDNADTLRESVSERVDYFAAIETDARGLDPFLPLLDVLNALCMHPAHPGDPWLEFQLRDERTEVTQANRLPHITMGQNLVTQRAVDDEACEHLLFMAADCMPPDDVLPRLLELDHPYCGPDIPTYGTAVRGTPFTIPVQSPDGRGWMAAPVEYAMPSAACVLIARRVFNRLRWRYDPVAGLSDDPAYQRDARELLGVNAIVRTDIKATHYPDAIGAVETRGADMTVVRP